MTDTDRPSPTTVYGTLFLGMILTGIVDLIAGPTVTLLGMMLGGFSEVGPANPVGGAVMFAGIGIGLSQWLWLVPAAALALLRSRPLAMGMLIGGVLIALLNGTCLVSMYSATYL